MTGAETGAAIFVAALAAVTALMWWRGELLQRELDRIRMEHRAWGEPGVWVCQCRRMRLDHHSRLPDGKGMVHNPRRCEPDLKLIGDDVA